MPGIDAPSIVAGAPGPRTGPPAARGRARRAVAAALGAIAALCATPAAPSDAPAPDAAPLAPVRGPGWSRDLRLTAEIAQQSALRDGSVAVSRTADDRLYIRVPLDVAFEPRAPSTRLRAFLRTLAGPLQVYRSTTVVLSEDGRPLAGPRSHAQAVLRYLAALGIDPGRLSIALGDEAGPPAGGAAADAPPCLQIFVLAGDD